MVSSRINEYSESSLSVGGSTALEDPIKMIEDEMDYAAIYVLRNAKEEIISPMVITESNHYNQSEDHVNSSPTRLIISNSLVGELVCPESYLRFVSLKLTSWHREVRQLIEPRSPEWRNQASNPYTGGSVYKPVAALKPFTDYECKLYGTITGDFTEGEKVTGTGGVQDITLPSGYIKSVGSNYLILNKVQGSWDVGGRGATGLSGQDSGATLTSITGVENEFSKYKVIKEYYEDIDLDTLEPGEFPGADNFSPLAGDIIGLNAQTDFDKNGVYLVKVKENNIGYLKLSSERNTNKMKSIEVFRAGSVNDEIEYFSYIPELKPEYLPNEIIDIVIYVCASRVCDAMERFDASQYFMGKAMEMMNLPKEGYRNEP